MFQATNEVITKVPESTQAEMQAAVDSCKAAFKTWSQTTILTRQQAMFKFQQLIKENLVRLLVSIVWIPVANSSLIHEKK